VTWNSAATPMTSTLDVIWQAPPNSVFANNQLGWETVTGGVPFPGNPTFNSSGCVLSNGNKTLTCTGQSFTVPASAPDANGTPYAGYGQMWANITADSGAPYTQEFRGGLSWTSNNGQISSTAAGPSGMTPGFKTPPQYAGAAHRSSRRRQCRSPCSGDRRRTGTDPSPACRRPELGGRHGIWIRRTQHRGRRRRNHHCRRRRSSRCGIAGLHRFSIVLRRADRCCTDPRRRAAVQDDSNTSTQSRRRYCVLNSCRPSQTPAGRVMASGNPVNSQSVFLVQRLDFALLPDSPGRL
jgi:hypothetical protein